VGRRLRLLAICAVAVATIAALAIFGFASKRTPSHGRLAPALPSERLAGSPTTVAGLVSNARGRPSLVLFWASWCGPCVHEAPAVERFSRSAGGRGRIVGVDWSDGLSGARAFVRRFGWTFPNVRDSEGTVGNKYEMTGLPTTFVLDGSGRIRATLRGPQTESSLGAALKAAERS
jgi:cytochrome c biogenesis protein CcmG/thiol:disulfide interchange protein DsbE